MDFMHNAPEVGIWSRIRKRDRPTGSKKFHYLWNLNMEKLGFFTGKIKKDIKCFPIPTEMEF